MFSGKPLQIHEWKHMFDQEVIAVSRLVWKVRIGNQTMYADILSDLSTDRPPNWNIY